MYTTGKQELCHLWDLVPPVSAAVTMVNVLKLLEVAAIVGRQSHSSFDREFLHQVHGITRFGLLAIIRST